MSSAAASATPFAIIVMGVSGCGKTTLGKRLAERWGCPFLEGDDFHADAAVAKMRSGHPLEDADRWPWLERIGAAAAESLASRGGVVVACSALRRTYRDRLRATIGFSVRFILLDPCRERLLQRLADRAGHFMPASLLDSQLDTLERPVGEIDVAVFDGEDSPSLLCERILSQFAPLGAQR